MAFSETLLQDILGKTDLVDLVGQVAAIAGAEPWKDGTYCLEVEAMIFDSLGVSAGSWLKQKTLITRRGGSLTMSASFDEFRIPGNTAATLTTAYPGGDLITMLITSHLDGGRVCARWTLERVGVTS